MTVMIFVLVVILAGAAFFAMASYETRGVLARQASCEAFYLADGAVERARARFLSDRAWRDGWNAERAGRGTYDLSVTDTTFMDEPNAVRLVATGSVEASRRSIEVMAKVPPTATGLTMLIMGDATAIGSLCCNGVAHVGGEADLNLACGEYTSGFEIAPSPVYTDPDSFPGATYYYVRGHPDGYALIYSAEGANITTFADSLLLDSVTEYDAALKTFTYAFDTADLIESFFDDAAGVFRRDTSDASVVVNFGEAALVDPPGVEARSAVILDGGVTSTIHATIVNTRFTGVTDEQRIDPAFWMGAEMTVKRLVVEPYNGIGAIAYDFRKVGATPMQLGTDAWPAYLYVTRAVKDLSSTFAQVGAVTCLGDWDSTGGPTLTYNPGFIDHLPKYLVDDWIGGVSGSLKVLRWREIGNPEG
jgi:hypothetical protein